MSLKHTLRKAADTADRNLSEAIKTAYALLRLAGRKKKAFLLNKNNINKAIRNNIKSHGVDDPEVLNANWASPIMGTARKMQQKFGWSDAIFEEVVTGLFEDIMMGQNLETGGSWKEGPIGKAVKDWIAEGLDVQKMLGRLGNKIYRKGITRGKKYMGSPGDGAMDYGLEKEYGDEGEVFNLAEEVFRMEGVARGQARQWMTLVEKNPELKALLDQVGRKIKRKDFYLWLVWKAWKKDPTSKSARHLGSIEVEYKDPETRERKKEPLWKALGKDKNTGMNYWRDKLVDVVKKMWPDLKDYIQ